jgi:hypothetical protein
LFLKSFLHPSVNGRLAISFENPEPIIKHLFNLIP